MMLVYSALYYTCKYNQLNYLKCASHNSTAVHILGHKSKSSIFSEKYKIILKTESIQEIGKKAQKHIKIGTCFTNFEKATLIEATIACMKGLKYLDCIKYPLFLHFYQYEFFSLLSIFFPFS